MNEALNAFFPIADLIAATFGPCCEVVIHDFSQPETSVVHVAGQVTGRKVGQSFDHLIPNVLLSEAFRNDLKDSTKIIIAQRISSVIDADKIIVLNEGAVTGVGSHDELLKSNKEYQEIYYSQMDKKEATA